MNTFKTVVLAAIGCGMSLAAGVAAAQAKPDFVFHVPVGLRSIHPDAKGMMVHCRVFKVRGNYTGENEIATSFGAGREYALVNVDAKGYFNGVVRVNAYTKPGKNAADGKYYECDLWMGGHAIDSGRSKGPQFESKAGTERRVQVSGPIR